MRFLGFDGRTHPLKLKSKSSNCSSGHIKARDLIKKLFPNDSVLEEIELPGSKKSLEKNLYADFFLVRERIIIEVHGKQHSCYTPFFHKNKLDFFAGQKRDRRKKEWCEMNDIIYIELLDSENLETWEQKIINEQLHRNKIK